jgi:ATP diphosphatase
MEKPEPPDALEQITRLQHIMAALRDPQTGCPWDREQDFASIAPYTIEEAYEVADAIRSASPDKLKEELGDLLLQIIFHARMAEELGQFTLADVAAAISEKMIRRHPHVFGTAAAKTAEAVRTSWEDIKAAERQSEAGAGTVSLLDGIATSLPAMMRAVKLQKRAARVGFDWPDLAAVLDKMQEEIAELRAELDSGAADPQRLQEETGDILFVAANIARKAGVDPETALLACNDKFQKRFTYIEQNIDKTGKSLEEVTLDEMEALWQEAKGKG